MAEHVHVSTLGLCGHLCGIVGESVCLTTLCCVLLYSYICEADGHERVCDRVRPPDNAAPAGVSEPLLCSCDWVCKAVLRIGIP